MLLAVSSALWSSASDSALSIPEGSQCHSCVFCLPPEYYPVDPSRPTAVGQLLSWTFIPFSTYQIRRAFFDSRIPHLRLLRLQGLVTLLTLYSLRTPVSFVSHSQRSWDSPFGASPFLEVLRRFHRNAPTYCSVSFLPEELLLQAVLLNAVPGFSPSQKALVSVVVCNHAYPDSSLGIYPSRVVSSASLGPPFGAPPLLCLAEMVALTAIPAGTSECLSADD